ncbi:peptide-methionine (S)-S-oxide reductase [Gillisia sp. Hel1_33_143]|uniref:peptide-methionine (S)-S-oxide reductase n=1 Tax=unclassified Gillisia TaxID=2615025 RepID=UPI0005554091|nr:MULTISPECIES: peptide-methionine (S)-S-oxide reductase [unclassified Gillisia]SDS59279.1 peptide-methionine (S)-S-oxide reductase [Gillisia sp. Hel1_33_143]
MSIQKVALGGGCHWCTEAVFQQLRGVGQVCQGYVRSTGENSNFSEAIIVHYDAEIISLSKLIEIHLYTHKSTSNHSFRVKYRSAVYYYTQSQKVEVDKILLYHQKKFNKNIITRALPLHQFKESREEIQDYYNKDPNKPFCRTYIAPKLQILLSQFTDNLDL